MGTRSRILQDEVVGSPDDPPDEVLVAAAVGGDDEAFATLARRYRRKVLRTALEIVGPERAEDAAQDALLLAYRALPALRDGAKFPGWISTIARFRAIRLSRSECRRRAAMTSVDHRILESYSAPEGDPEAPEDGVGELLRALEEIPPEFARVIRLHFFEGRPHLEIAGLLGISVSTAKWRCFRAKELLRRALKSGGAGEAQIDVVCRRCGNCRREASGESCGCAGDPEIGRNDRQKAPLPGRSAATRFQLPVFEVRTGSQTAPKEGPPVKRRASAVTRHLGALILAFPLVRPGSLLGREPGAGSTSREEPAKPRFARSVTEYQVPDLKLVDQQGRTVSLRELLNEQRPVALNFFFASCGSICPVMTATFSRMRKELGHDGDGLRVVSITIDPDQDTPEVLKAYAERFSAGPGWSFLTGDAGNILAVQRAFFADSGGKFNHRLLYFFRAAGSKSWVRIEGLANAADLAKEARGLVAPVRASR